MLHLLVATHRPESCPRVAPELKKTAEKGGAQFGKVTKALGIKVCDAWNDVPGHTMYFLLDAPNAHVVAQMAGEIKLTAWSTVNVIPVKPLW
jgi:hypothetical protein